MDANEIEIEVAFAGVNRADLMQQQGHYPPPPGASDILGLEVSGWVRATGTGVHHFQRGQAVCALLAGGGYAPQVRVPAGQVLPVPESLSLAEAAGIPEAYATAWYNLFMLADAQPQEKALIHAGASGVGSAAIQLCKAFGIEVFVTVGSDAKLDYCRALGATQGWNRKQGSFVDAVNAFGGADVILDPVGGDYLSDNQKVLNAQGRMIMIGLLGGRTGALDCGRMLMKNQRIQGSTLRNKPVAVKTAIMQQLHEHAWPLFSQAQLHPQLDRIFPLAAQAEAHQYLQADKNQGKVVLQVASDAVLADSAHN